MLRFAPSPTGDMLVDDLRVALFNYIVAKQKNEGLIVRIEDTDKEKNIEGKDQEILDILNLFNIEYSQVIYQSQNIRFHTSMALQLLHEKKAFSCFCSDEWLKKKMDEAKEAKKPYSYDGACENLPAELVIDNTNPFTVRIKKPLNNIIIEDYIQGEVLFKPDIIGSFVIMNRDKTPTHNFACAIDDMLSDISLIIRSDKHTKNTPEQVHIRASLNYDKKIEYAHLPPILDDDNISVKWLLEEGYLPEAISNYLISTLSNPSKEVFTLKEALKWFDLTKIENSPNHFDIDRLRDINKKHLKNLDSKELSRYVGFADEEIGELAKLYLEEIGTTKELRNKIKPIFSAKIIPDEFKEQSKTISEIIKDAPYFDNYNDFKSYVMKKSGFKEENFIKTLRLLLTGSEDGPDIAKIYKCLKNYIGEIIK